MKDGKIIYNDINVDKQNLILIITNIIPFYSNKNFHKKITICNKWITLLNIRPLQTEYDSHEIFNLQEILNDSANINLSFGNFEIGKLSMNLLFKVGELFNKDN